MNTYDDPGIIAPMMARGLRWGSRGELHKYKITLLRLTISHLDKHEWFHDSVYVLTILRYNL